MGFDYQGMSFQEQRAAEGVPAWAVFGLSLLFVFLILAALYESWSLPFSVLLSTPVAILGAYLALSMRALENDIFATVGLVMLIGLSAKNAILIVEFAVLKYREGESIAASALYAARLRFRPIVMTALAFIFGCLPLWTATGAGCGIATHSRHCGHRRHGAGHLGRHFDDPGHLLRGGIFVAPTSSWRQGEQRWIHAMCRRLLTVAILHSPMGATHEID